jgi:alpha-galactosidase
MESRLKRRTRRTLGVMVLTAALAIVAVSAQSEGAGSLVAARPPMGWNSWDSFGLSVTEQEFQANANWMAQHLLKFGWEYAVVDEGWYLPNPDAKAGSFRFNMDAHGRYAPAANRFPLAAKSAGFKELAEWTHARKLKFGIHIIRGIPREAVEKNLVIAGSRFRAAEAANKNDTCRWNADNYGVKANAAGQAYYDSIAALYANWGVDFVKIDCITVPYLSDEIRMFSDALGKTGRPIALSLSPGPTPIEQIGDLRKRAQMWRISDDFWDHWKKWPDRAWSQSLLDQFGMAAKWAPNVEAGHWPDADMLPIGYLGPRPGEGKARTTDLTHDEQKTLLTLWSMLRSPLIAGCNFTQIDESTTGLFTNEEVIGVDQRSRGSREVLNDGKKAIWMSKPESGSGAYVAIFNLSDAAQRIEYPLQAIGLSGVSFRVRDLWAKKDAGTMDVLKVSLQPHASALYRLQ